MSGFCMKAKTSIYVDKDKWAQFRGRSAMRGLQASDLFEEMMDDDAASECLLAGLLDAWRLTEAYHICGADALQIATAKHAHAPSFLSGDHALHNAAAAEGLDSQWLH